MSSSPREALVSVSSHRSLSCIGRSAGHFCLMFRLLGVVLVLWCSIRLLILACCLSRLCLSE